MEAPIEPQELNIFMMCAALDRTAMRPLPDGFAIRKLRPSELALWKAMPFDTDEEAAAYAPFMDAFFERTYGGREDLFFEKTLVVCDLADRPVATCLLWHAYGVLHTLHWFKVRKDHEGRGIGRALLSVLMGDVPQGGFPIYLHTQPGSDRAINLYSDFGFCLLTDPQFGARRNDLPDCLPLLQAQMPAPAFGRLRMCAAPPEMVRFLETVDTVEF